jgi:uncharacterized protein YjgD (DUF1641 family)
MSDSVNIDITEGGSGNVNIDITESESSSSTVVEINETPVPVDPVDNLTDLDTTVTGAELDALKTKSDGIEDGATADQTDAEIKTAYENNADTNAFTDADHTKLDGIEAGADVTDTTNVTAAGALMDSEVTNLDQVKAFDSSDYAAALGADDNYVTDDEKVVIGNTSGTNTGDQDLSAYQLEPSEGAFVDGDKTKLDGIESGATADQSADEIKSLVDSATDSNVFTDADHTKLDGIEAGADVTDTDNVVSSLTAGSNITIDSDGTISSTDTNDNTQLSNEEVQDIVGGMVTGNSETGITVTYQDADGTLDFSVTSQTDENFTTADHTKLDGIEDGADVTPAWVPSSDPSYATETYVDTEVSNLVDSAPGTLDTLNELASALGDDANFSTTVTNNIATKLPLAGGTMTGNITMSGSETVDGRDLSVDGAKLDGIETGATADQTGAEIKSLYEGEADTNAFTDADHTKLDGIETGADVTDTANVSAAGALMDSEVTNLADVKSFDPADYAPALGADDNYVTDDEKFVIGNTSGTNTGDQDLSAYQLEPSEGAFVDGDKTKLDGIEASADVTDTANVVAALSAGTNITIAGDGTISSTGTGTELSDEEVQDIVGGMVSGNTQTGITVTYQDVNGTLDFSVASQTDENFTTADHTKLDGIESGADVTDTDNVTAAGALMDSEVTNLDQVKSFDSSDYATSAQGTLADSATQPGDLGTAASLDVGTSANEIVQLDGSARLPAVDASQLTNLPSGATQLSDLSDVNTSTATNRNVLIADGVDFESRTLVEADISDLGSYLTDITGESLASLSDVTTTGAQLDAIKTKVDGIEANADVTDTTNVTAAGALMDSEVTNLDQVKAFDSSDYATSAQGALADSATQPGDALSSLDTTVTGSELNALKTKLDGIESGATADQTGAEIKTAYEGETDTNAFTDAEKTKLGNIEESADVTDTTNVVAALTAGTNVTIGGDGTISATDTNTQLSDEEVQDIVGGMVTTNTESGINVTYDDTAGTLDFTVASQTDENFTTADHTKLDGIETGATADQTADEIRTLVNSATDSNVFTDADHTKLDGISSGADVTPAWVPSSDPSYATETYVDTEVSNLVDSAPGTLDTLNELAAALGDDPNFATTVSTSIGTKLPLAGGTMTGNIVMSGSETVDGRDLSVDGTKLDGIESGATADQTGAEIKVAYEAEADTNAFTDADHTKLDGIETGADVTDTDNVVSALTAGTNVTIAGDGTISSTDTNTQLSDEEVQDIVGGMVAGNTESGISVTYDDTDGTLDFTVASQTDENFTTADHTKLDGIEAGATADQTGAEIKSLYEGEADTNAFTDAEKTLLSNQSGTNTGDQDLSSYQLQPSEGAFVDGDKTKLDGIESGADVTDTANVVSALTAGSNITIGGDGTISSTDTNTQLSDEEVQDIVGGMVTANTESGISVTYDDTDGTLDFSVASQTDENFTTDDHTKLDGIESGADVTDTANVTAAGALMDSEVTNLDQVKAFDSSDYAPALGADDNYVTDAEKIVIGNTSGTNTGDQDLSSYQLEPTEGAFVDGDKTKLDGIESGADVTDTANVTAAGALMDSEVTNLADVKAFDPTDYAVALGADDNYVTDAEKIVIGNTSGTNTGDQDLSSYQLQPSEGAFVDGDKTKLDGIESGATADQTGAEIKTAYEGETDTNAFTDSEKSKLENIEASADVTDTTNVVAALTAGTNIAIAGDGTISSTDTNTQLSDEEVQDVVGGMVTTNTESGISVTYDDTAGKLDFSVTSQTDENFTTADHAKLDGIEANATADQTASEIRSLVDSATDSNVFTDADHTKLDGISSGADVTPAWVPSSDPSYATETYVDTEVSNLVDAAPGTLDTLNELAAALGDDPNFSTTVTNNIASKLPLAGGTMTGNIVMSSSETVDGRDLSVDGAKLDGIEANATADQTASEIRSLVDSATDSNVFTDADHTKLDGIEASADVTDTDNVVSALTAGTNITIAGDGTISSTDTNTQLSDEEVQDIIGGMVTTNTESGISVTYDDTGGKLDFSVTSQTDENFTTADHAKLDGIEAGADVTDTTNVTAAGALMDSEVTNLADVKSFNPADYATALGADDNYVTDAEKIVIGNTSGTNTGDQDLSSYQLQPSEGAFADGDKTKLDGIATNANVTPSWVPESDPNYASTYYVDNEIDTHINDLISGAPAALNTLDELAAALGDDANFSTTVTNSIATKLPLAGGTMTGNIVMSGLETVDGRDLSVDGAKLDGIETSADVTDTTNVVAALTAGTNIAIAGDGTISATAQAEYADLDYAKRSSTSTQSINGTPAAIPWQTEVKTGTNITWSSANNTRFTIGEDGTYYVGGSISVYSASTERCMHIVQIRVNGSVVGYPRGTSYIRNTWTAWDWWTIEVANTPIDLVSGDYVEFFVATVNADTEAPSNNGTTSLNGDASEAWVIRANGTKGDTGGSRISREYQVFDASLAANEKELLFVATKPGTIHWVGAVVDDPGTEDVQLSILNANSDIGSNITLSSASSYADYGYGVTEYNSSFSAGDVIEVEIFDPGEGEGSGAVAAQGPIYIEVVLSYND